MRKAKFFFLHPPCGGVYHPPCGGLRLGGDGNMKVGGGNPPRGGLRKSLRDPTRILNYPPCGTHAYTPCESQFMGPIWDVCYLPKWCPSGHFHMGPITWGPLCQCCHPHMFPMCQKLYRPHMVPIFFAIWGISSSKTKFNSDIDVQFV